MFHVKPSESLQGFGTGPPSKTRANHSFSPADVSRETPLQLGRNVSRETLVLDESPKTELNGSGSTQCRYVI